MVTKKELCIVHIGMPKTGSSTLQKALFDCNSNIQNELIYPYLGETHQTGIFCGLFHPDPVNYYYFKNQNFTSEMIEEFNRRTVNKILKDLNNSYQKICIFSSEDLFHLPISSIEKLYCFLKEYFEKVIVVAYVRTAKSFMESAFQQLVKHHDLGSFNFSIIYHTYKNFERYDNVFGASNVKLWKFEPSLFPKNDILLDFCTKMNLQPMESLLKVVNESFSLEAVSILFTYHFHSNVKQNFGTKKNKVNQLLIEKIGSIGCQKFRFSNSLIQSVIDQYEDDYQWIVNRVGETMRMNLDAIDKRGINNERELLWLSIRQIKPLVNLLQHQEKINFELLAHPQTVAKLVNLLAIELAEGVI